MQESLYIICVNEKDDWWQVRDTTYHLVMATGKGKETIVDTLKKLVKKYRNSTVLMEGVEEVRDTAKMKAEVINARKEEYSLLEMEEDLLEETIGYIKEALAELKNPIKKLLKKVNKKVEEVSVEIKPKKLTKVVKKVEPNKKIGKLNLPKI